MLVLLRQVDVVTAAAAIAGFDTHHGFVAAYGNPAFVGGHPATRRIGNGDVFDRTAQVWGGDGLLVIGGAAGREQGGGKENKADAHNMTRLMTCHSKSGQLESVANKLPAIHARSRDNLSRLHYSA